MFGWWVLRPVIKGWPPKKAIRRTPAAKAFCPSVAAPAAIAATTAMREEPRRITLTYVSDIA